jgi:HPt (histidine-containing phosphotransfer) domain-containing protein
LYWQITVLQIADIMEGILFDTALLDELGSKKSTMRVLEFYLNDSPKYLLDIEKLLAEKDIPGLINKSHKLKGSLGMLKADLLVSLLNQMETAAKSELNFDKLPELFALIKEKLVVLDGQLKQEIKKLKESL